MNFARLIAPVVTTTSIVNTSIKPANPGWPGKMAVKTERERERESLRGRAASIAHLACCRVDPRSTTPKQTRKRIYSASRAGVSNGRMSLNVVERQIAVELAS